MNGKQHGKGTYTNAEGVKREGEWVEGRRVKWLDEEDNKKHA